MPGLRCPVCKADNAAGPTCRRCKADLTLLFDLEAERERCLAEAHRRGRRGDWPGFREAAERAHALRADDLSRRLCVAGRLLTGAYTAARALARAGGAT